MNQNESEAIASVLQYVEKIDYLNFKTIDKRFLSCLLTERIDYIYKELASIHSSIVVNTDDVRRSLDCIKDFLNLKFNHCLPIIPTVGQSYPYLVSNIFDREILSNKIRLYKHYIDSELLDKEIQALFYPVIKQGEREDFPQFINSVLQIKENLNYLRVAKIFDNFIPECVQYTNEQEVILDIEIQQVTYYFKISFDQNYNDGNIDIKISYSSLFDKYLIGATYSYYTTHNNNKKLSSDGNHQLNAIILNNFNMLQKDLISKVIVFLKQYDVQIDDSYFTKFENANINITKFNSLFNELGLEEAEKLKEKIIYAHLNRGNKDRYVDTIIYIGKGLETITIYDKMDSIEIRFNANKEYHNCGFEYNMSAQEIYNTLLHFYNYNELALLVYLSKVNKEIPELEDLLNRFNDD